ncbi:hypothetical protein RUM44_003773 [Polyplax serrata]|uniref:K Homology domain-containing protein n=1 Tax=Polyplax serrata TaxID=468196 RepID=A0ABR1AHD2_POLSC
MSSSARQLARVISRPAKKLQKPRPLKTLSSRHSTVDANNVNTFEEIMLLVEAVAGNISNETFDRGLQSHVISMSGLLKIYGHKLEVIYKDQLDRAFVIFRNGSRDENLDYTSRLHLLELIELRAMNWMTGESVTYYKQKFNHPDVDILSLSSTDSFSSNNANAFQNAQMINTVSPVVSPPLLLGPGEIIKSSGKFPSPAAIPGKIFCKDEVVIRNSDSGKVNPSAKERLVEITGPSEDKINYAKQLMEETIRRNASPIRSELLEKEKHGSNSSLNSSASDDGSKFPNLNDASKRTSLLHSFSTSDATIGEYKYTVTIGEDTLKITGTNPDLVTTAKLVLDEYFLSESTDVFLDSAFDDGTNFYHPVHLPESEDDVFRGSIEETGRKIVETEKFQVTEGPPISLTKNLDLDPESDRAARKIVRISEDLENILQTDGVIKAPIIKYTSETIIKLADSKLSRRTPEGWANKSKEEPSIMRKPPIVWFDSATYMKQRPQEIDAINAIRSMKEIGSPEPE